MSDLEDIRVCEKCLKKRDVEVCPKCNKTTVVMPSILLATLRVLKAKGWVVCEWKKELCSDEDYSVRLRFKFFAPPPEFPVVPDITNIEPWLLTFKAGVRAKEQVYRALYQWAAIAPEFMVPFAQDFCDLCKQQGADWYFSRCRCPINRARAEGGQYRNFGDGYPEKCVYIVEQIITLENRIGQLHRMGYFDLSKIAMRRCNGLLGKGKVNA